MVRAMNTTVRGYSDAVNHALAFAAKHHDRQVRKGTRLPYLTHPANVAVILTRYDRDEPTVIAGILHDVVEDCVRVEYTRQMLEQRIGDKFGTDVLETVLRVTKRSTDDDGEPLSRDEQKEDYLERLGSASESALWVCAADKLHNANTILSDLRRTVDDNSVWSRFNAGKEGTVQWYRDVLNRLESIGFSEAIVAELREAVEALESH